jgi:hypothetical protein
MGAVAIPPAGQSKNRARAAHGEAPRTLAREEHPRTVRWRVPNPRDIEALDRALLKDARDGWRLLTHYYIRDAAQVRQLEETGFVDVVMLGDDGLPVRDELRAKQPEFLLYRCRKPER